jgi:hypothetical protein
MTQDDIMDALQRQKQQLEGQLPSLLSRCQTDPERTVLTSAYARASQQWSEAVNKALRTNNPLLASLVGDLNNLQDDIAAMIAESADFGSLLQKIATGVGIGAKIVALIK